MTRPHVTKLGPSQGFTLIELVMVMVLVGILAVFVAPRLLDMSVLDARGFHDQTLSVLRFAQKTAIAQRRPVCVAFTATTATLRIDTDRNNATGVSGCEADLMGPRGEVPGLVVARSPVQYAATPSAMVFDGLGQPAAGQTIQVSGLPQTIVVEAVTGHVHD